MVNKIYLAGFSVLLVAPPAQKDSQARLWLRSRWPVIVLGSTLLIYYFTAGLSKMTTGTWLSHPDTLLSHLNGPYTTELGAFLLRHLPAQTWTGAMYFTIAFELFAPLLFVYRHTRLYAIIIGITFHLGVAALMHGLIFFSLQMITFYTLFISGQRIAQASLRVLNLRATNFIHRPPIHDNLRGGA